MIALNSLTRLWPATKPAPHADFLVWKTVKLGLYNTADEYREALKKADYRIGKWANDILGKTHCAKQEMEVDLIVASVGELGFTRRGQYKDICARAVEMDLALCPPEVGPALPLAYDEQPKDECLIVAMKAISDSHGRRLIFAVEHDLDERRLDGRRSHSEDFWSADYRFVFVRCKSWKEN